MQKISRRKFLKLCGQLTIGAGLAVYGGYSYAKYIEPEWLAVERVQVPIKGLHPALEGFKIVQLSDIHLHPHIQLDDVQQAINLTNSLQPDLVVLTGDYVSQSAESIFELAPALTQLNPKYGIFSALGNHDHWTNVNVVTEGFRQQSIPLLKNKGVNLGVGRASLYIAGLDDIWSGQPDLAATLDRAPANAVTVLLAHEPDFADIATQDGRIQVQLSGHSHGGQVRLPGVGAPILPRMARKYDQGLYRLGDMWLYTTRGVGLSAIPLRFNCPPEVTEITLISA